MQDCFIMKVMVLHRVRVQCKCQLDPEAHHMFGGVVQYKRRTLPLVYAHSANVIESTCSELAILPKVPTLVILTVLLRYRDLPVLSAVSQGWCATPDTACGEAKLKALPIRRPA
jgi:hypothetical protein